jgi:hypothetical protein
MFAHLGAGVPHVREIARGKLGVAGRIPGHPAMIAVGTDRLKRG